MGVILYEMITGEDAFGGESMEDVKFNVSTGNLDLAPVIASGCSDQLQDLLKKLLEYDEEDRITASNALKHDFFAEKAIQVRQEGMAMIDKRSLNKLIDFSIETVFKREMIGLMVQAFENDKELRRMNSIFLAVNTDFSGTLTFKELDNLYKGMGYALEKHEVEELIDSLYITEKGVITFLELKAGLLEEKFYTDEKRLKLIFEYLDWDKSKFVDTEDIKRCFRRFGRDLDHRKVEKMI